IIMVTPPQAADGSHELESAATTSGFGSELDVPVIHMTPEALGRMLNRSSTSLDRLIDAANRGDGGVRHLSWLARASLDTEVRRNALSTFNIGGILPGSGELTDGWVIVGGHYDHIGHGYTGSRSPGSNAIHPGADDNASGTAGVLVLAQRLKAWADEHEGDRRNILFMGFGGEEAGLHGSRYFVDTPSIDLSKASVMVNLDMIGRLRDDSVMLGGTGTAEEFDELLLPHVEASGLTVHASRGGTGPSDHASFFSGGVPVLFFFTGLHDDYHRPEDEAWTVDPEGGLRIVELAEDVIQDVATRGHQLTFINTSESGPARRTGARVRLGIMPAYGADLETGVQVESVTAGTSAAEGGLKAGDVLLTWNGDKLDGGRDLMAALRTHDPGDEVKLEILRDGKKVPVAITLKGRD
ncbi:MAG: M28 family peptidase, partial [Phycisphaerales bacterium]|nr:M28 family peptidase [Phycisphaerales bacterium]